MKALNNNIQIDVPQEWIDSIISFMQNHCETMAKLNPNVDFYQAGRCYIYDLARSSPNIIYSSKENFDDDLGPFAVVSEWEEELAEREKSQLEQKTNWDKFIDDIEDLNEPYISEAAKSFASFKIQNTTEDRLDEIKVAFDAGRIYERNFRTDLDDDFGY